MSTYIKLSKAQISKPIQSGGSFGSRWNAACKIVDMSRELFDNLV